MAPKITQPITDKAEVRGRLERALTTQRWVRLRRWYPYAEPITGYVVGVGRKFVAVARTSDGLEPDGFDFVRIRDVLKVGMKRAESVPTRVLKARGQWPLTGMDVRLDRVREVLTDAGRDDVLLAIHAESRRIDAHWVGKLIGVENNDVRLEELTPRAEWGDPEHPLWFKLRSITRVTVGDGYLQSLALIAPPASNHR